MSALDLFFTTFGHLPNTRRLAHFVNTGQVSREEAEAMARRALATGLAAVQTTDPEEGPR